MILTKKGGAVAVQGACSSLMEGVHVNLSRDDEEKFRELLKVCVVALRGVEWK